ncbi:MAG: hypothetical protein ACRCZ9_12320 [Fusobacteriaceae bacterium]
MDIVVILDQIRSAADNYPMGGSLDSGYMSILTPQPIMSDSETPNESWYGYIENSSLVREELIKKFGGVHLGSEVSTTSVFYDVFVNNRIDVMARTVLSYVVSEYRYLYNNYFSTQDTEKISALQIRFKMDSFIGAALQFYLYRIISDSLDIIDLSIYMYDVINNRSLRDVIYYGGSPWCTLKLGRNSNDVRLVNSIYDKVSMELIGLRFE